MDQLAPGRAGAGEEEEGDTDAGVGQDVPFEYKCEGYCVKKKRISFEPFVMHTEVENRDLPEESGTAIAWKKSRACCSEVECTMLVLEGSLVASATAMMNARKM